MEKVKLCKDCKHYSINNYWNSEEMKREYALCDVSTLDPVNGSGECKKFRKGRKLFAKLKGLCGKEGRYWEPKG